LDHPLIRAGPPSRQRSCSRPVPLADLPPSGPPQRAWPAPYIARNRSDAEKATPLALVQ